MFSTRLGRVRETSGRPHPWNHRAVCSAWRSVLSQCSRRSPPSAVNAAVRRFARGIGHRGNSPGGHAATSPVDAEFLEARCRRRLCCVDGSGARSVDGLAGLDNSGQFVERHCNGETGEGVDTEFVVAAAQVLHERMPADHDRCGSVAFETAHRLQSGLQSSVVGFDPVVAYCVVS